MDEVDNPKEKVIRAPNLKRGKAEERITDRVVPQKRILSAVSPAKPYYRRSASLQKASKSKPDPSDKVPVAKRSLSVGSASAPKSYGKRGKKEAEHGEFAEAESVKLEKVLGVTVNSNVALDSNNNGSVAYPAGCTVVLFNTRTEQQNHIINTSRKTVTSLAYSQCGRYIVTGECGHLPSVRVWDLYSNGQSGNPGLAPQPQQVAEFMGHRYGVNCVTFSPNGKYVVSVGTQHDMIVNVWDWRNNIKVASNKISTKIKAIAFAENGSYFVTVGNRNVKFWYMEHGKSRYKEAVPLMGRLAILGEQRNHYFCDVACGKGDCGDSTYAITRSGLLCEFNNRRLLDKWVELRTNSANCIVVGLNYIFVGCAEGIIRCFNPSTLEFITTLPRPHYLGVDVSLGVNITHMGTAPQDAKYPDCVAITYDETNSKLTAIYNDHSIYVWHVLNIKRVGKSYSFLYHSACIWGVEMAPPNSPLPHGSFLTCSSDDTIRVWTLDKMTENNSRGIYRKNIYSNELLKVVYVDKEHAYLKDLDVSRSNGNDKVQQDSYNDGRNGVRCIRMSPDGRNVASGDRSGNIRILDASNMEQMYKIEAHDAEVLCLEYCGNENEVSYMASASRDRLLHVFDAKNYTFLQTLDDHSSSITAVRFMTQNKNLQMVSCSADKSIIFRALSEVSGKTQFSRYHNATGKATLYDMEVDANQKHVLTACQDRNVRVYSVNSGKNTKCFKGSGGDDGTLIKVSLDRSGIYVATSCTDKSLSIYDYYSGECMATMCGHSELAAGLRFTNDCRRLISASGDGCIFVWKIPHDMVVTMHARLSQQAMRQGKSVDEFCEDYEFNENAAQDFSYRFSVGNLPQWAKKHVTGDSSQPPSMTKNVAQPRGKWAQRAENVLHSDTFVPSVPHIITSDKRFDSDGSKDSSLESTTETRKEISAFKEISSSRTVITSRLESRRRGDTMSDTGFESAAHDADIDSDHDYKNLYYPAQADSPSGSEFTVTNIDADELRKSQRKKKENKVALNVKLPQPNFDSNDSDDDEDDASTPSGDNTDRNPMSLFSVSSESLDQLASREKFFQTTFESMSGAETELTPRKTSISSKFLTRSVERNSDAINAVKQAKTDPETMKVRQELHKRIAETKKKLESVGHSTPLRYSQSIHDLSHIPERDKWQTNKQQANYLDESSPDSSLRRSCSLSDLSMQKATNYKRKNEPISGKKAPPSHVPRNNTRYVKNNAITRSRSSGGLNQSDSDNDSHDKKVSRLMRPTISSHNKINNKNLQNRKKQSYSTNNLNTVGVDNISTSDEELEPVVKPVVPPRNRQGSFENGHPSVVPRRFLNNKEKMRANRHTIHFERLPTLEASMTSDDLNLTSENADQTLVELSNNKSEEVISQLTVAANNVVELYNRLNDSEITGDSSGDSADREDAVRKLELSIVRTHKVLHDCIFKKLKQNNGNIDVNQTDTVKKLNDLVTKGSNSHSSIVTMMEQYSDILLDMVQQKIHNSNM
ncbi:mitogen-activated protein kinase-binding protein 1 isoform X2 [Harmonia axyridis]|uniref:mitogen-activated protein kinase-binding protein 1 isoform X2 n=1 Tax=Harmonia axyridis TaxID=115357 RepID=UPI001E277E4B|nr:mitogen-activated protein kinase-binding protein 1 isoform X2 [Harmonia axyridis]